MKTINSRGDKVIFSFKRRLIIASVSITSVLALISWAAIFSETHHEIEEIYDARLGQSAKILALSVPHMLKEPEETRAKAYANWYQDIEQYDDDDAASPFGHPYEKNLMFQFYQQEKIVIKSPGAPEALIGYPDLSGFSQTTINGEEWRRFQIQLPTLLVGEQPAYLVVAERLTVRNELIGEIALSTAIPQLALIAAIAVAIILLANKFFQPIKELREAIADRHINHLAEITVSQPTVELAPLVSQLNYLLSELDKAWQREKRLTRTAAHELKTPLSVLRLNAENALVALAGDRQQELQSDLQQILKGIDRTDRLIQQLLMLSKIEAHHQYHLANCDVADILREVIATMAPLALRNQQSLELRCPDALPFNGHALLLSALFSNLIDNAIRYAGRAANITVTAQLTNPNIIVTVNDSGLPIPLDIRDKIFEKFFRAHTERGDGAGLGMSIVRDIASLHNGEISLLPASSGNGNTFQVTLPTVNSLTTPK
ncbi:ATP-binding protein [Photobacterium gaetbulicola]|uniref:sensor histidine kinase n=1 Tax=Photobacterium gaetbulicola TaxID=1295392 RepID=UPI000AC77878|nr:ATP-binding protein [Photobacterium gaetbulicola]